MLRVIGSVMTLALVGSCATVPENPPAQTTVYGFWRSFLQTDAAKYGGREGIIYRSEDGTRVAGAFTHSGKYSYTFPFDEFVYVTSGSVHVSIRSGPKFTLNAGDVTYFRKGMVVDFEASDDYGNVAMFVDDRPIKW